MYNIAYINSRGKDPSTGTGSYRKNLLNELQRLEDSSEINIDELNLTSKKEKMLNSLKDVASYDLIHLEPDPYWHIGLLLRKFISNSPKIAMTLHGVSPILYSEKVPLKQRFRVNTVMRKLTPLIDGIFTVSKSERHLISTSLNYPKNDIYVTYNGNSYNGIYSSDIKNNSPNDRKYILHISNSPNWRKDPELLLDSFEYIADADKSVDLLLVGGGWENKDKINRISERNLGNRISIAGKVQPHKLPRYYAHSELYLQTSVYESFCMPVVEAMNFGVPVVTTTAYALPEIARDAAMYVDRIPSQISDVVLSLLEDRELYREKSKKSMDISKKYTWERSAKNTLKYYKEMLENK